MKSKIIFFYFLILNPVFAITNEEQVLNYSKALDQSYQKLAKTMVLINLNRLYFQFSGNIKAPSEVNLNKTFSDIFDQIIKINYGEQSYKEKVNTIVKIQSELVRLKDNWLDSSIKVKSNYRQFYDNLKRGKEVLCGKESFNESLVILGKDNLEISGVNLGSLNREWKIGGNISLSENGENLGGNFSLTTEKKPSAQATANIVSTVSGAAISTMAKYLGVSILGGPVAIGVAAALVVELVFEIGELKKAQKEMERLAVANGELFRNLRFEKGVREYYSEYCQKFETSYIESNALLESFKAGKVSEDEILQQIKDHDDYLEKKNTLVNISNLDLINNSDEFYHFFSSNILKGGIELRNNSNLVLPLWKKFTEQFDATSDLLKSVLFNVIKNQNSNSGSGSYYLSVMDDLQKFTLFRDAFITEILGFIQIKDFIEKQNKFTKIAEMFNNFKESKESFTEDESDFILAYEEILASLGKELK